MTASSVSRHRRSCCSRSSPCSSSRSPTNSSTAPSPTAARHSPGRRGRSARAPAGWAAGASSPPTSSSWPTSRRSPVRTRFSLFHLDDLAASTFWSTVAGVIWIIVMTWICYKGIEVSARLQYGLLGIELVILFVFSVVALTKVYSNNATPESLTPSISWLWPSDMSLSRRRDRHAHRRVHLLGLGHRCQHQRGDRRPAQDAGSRGHHLHAAAPGDLCAGLDRNGRLRRRG